MAPFPHLFSPLTVRGYTLRNRIETAPTYNSTKIFDLPGIDENVFRMLERRAAGGAAMVLLGESAVNNEDARFLFPFSFRYDEFDNKYFYGFKEYADRIHRHGALALAELCHEGIYADANPAFGPSASVEAEGKTVVSMTEEMMEKVCRDFALAAAYMIRAGFDGVMVHGGHGFLIQQFASPLFNHRTDEYGGTPENRARFPRRVFRAIRAAIGDDKILELRMSAEDGLPGGMQFERDTLPFLCALDGEVDIIQVSNGHKLLGNRTYTFTDMFDRHGHNVPYAQKLKAALSRTMVSVIGGINSPELGEEIIAQGWADLIAMGRQCFADPDFPRKAREGKADLIRRCVRCFGCYPGFKEEPTDTDERWDPRETGHCSINPDSGFFFYPEWSGRPKGSRKVLIIGGGVSGMQAALTAKARGHRPVLVEQQDHLGGTLCFTDRDMDKADLREFKNTLIRQVRDAEIDVRLGVQADPEYIRSEEPDVVLLAIGAAPARPPIPGIEYGMNALEVYTHPERIGDSVLIIGGGLVGCEVALHLAGLGRQVTVAELQNRLAPEAIHMYRSALMEELEKRKVSIHLGLRCLEIGSTSAVFRTEGGQNTTLYSDTVIYALGMSPRSFPLDGTGIPVIKIGDCRKPGNVRSCTTDGYRTALEIL